MSTKKLKFHVFSDDRFVDLNLYQFGWEQCAPLHSYGPYVRNHYLFHYVISGQGKLYANEEEYSIESGQGFLISPGQITSYCADEKNPWSYVWLEFDGLRARESLTLAGLSATHPVYYSANSQAGLALQKQMMLIVDHADYSPTRLIGHGFIFLDQIIQSSKFQDVRTSKRLRDFYMKEAMSFIEQNYQRDFSIEDIATFCGLNRSYFGRIFRETMGDNPRTFLLQYRMAKAAQLLKETKIPIQEISPMVGYPNQLHFSRAFKNLYGISPRNYRLTHFIQPPTK